MQSSFRCKLLCKISDLCSGFLELLLPAIVGVDPHRHVRRGVAGKVLDLLHRQAVFDPPGNAGVPELVRVDIKVQRAGKDSVLCRGRRTPIGDQVPHPTERRLRQELPVPHAKDITGYNHVSTAGRPQLPDTGH